MHNEPTHDTITLSGLVATDPKFLVTSYGLPICSFRFASTQRRWDERTRSWVDGNTNWYTVSAFRRLAENVSTSVKKGHRIILSGNLNLRDWELGDRVGLHVEIEATAIGHDLNWGTTEFTRSAADIINE